MKFSIIERIRYILEREDVSQLTFSKRTGIPNSTVASVLSRGSNPSGVFLAKLIEAFPNYSANWILTGLGERTLPPETRTKAQIEYQNLFRIDENPKKKYDVAVLANINGHYFSAFSLVELKKLILLLNESLDLIKKNNM